MAILSKDFILVLGGFWLNIFVHANVGYIVLISVRQLSVISMYFFFFSHVAT